MRRIASVLAGLVAGLACAGPAMPDGLGLTPDARAAFGAEVRRALLDDPAMITDGLAPPDPYAADKSADLSLIAAHGVALFGQWPAPRHVAFFSDGCADCAQAGAELDARAQDAGWTVHRHAMDSDLARSLGVPDAPFYVLPEIMIRGWMPAPALARYIN